MLNMLLLLLRAAYTLQPLAAMSEGLVVLSQKACLVALAVRKGGEGASLSLLLLLLLPRHLWGAQ